MVTTATHSVTVALDANPGGATLSGTKTMSAVNGVATFPNLTLDKPGQGYTLIASASGLPNITSDPFNISTGIPSRLAFLVPPSHTAGGMVISPAVKVAVTDEAGNVIPDIPYGVTVALGTNPSGGTLKGTQTLRTVNGVVTFADLSIDKAGEGYTLAASTVGLSGTTSMPFNITSSETTPPTLESPTLQPTVLSIEGGVVRMSVRATDSGGVQSVWAEVTKPDSSQQTINLSLQSGNTYAGTFNAPANPTGSGQTYTVTFFARDAASNQAGPTNPVEFSVALGDAPPVISNPNLSRTTLSSKGGKVTLSAVISDDKGVTEAWALIDNTTRIDLKRKGNLYSGLFRAPKNTTPTVQTFTIGLFARDTTGTQTGPVTAGTVTVQGKGSKPQGVLGEDDDELTLKPNSGTSLTVRLLSASRSKDSGVRVFLFTLNRPARVEVRLLSPTGKLIRRLEGVAAQAGLNHFVWEGKTQTGAMAARGIYLLQLTAADEGGSLVQAVTTVVVR